MLSRMIRRAVVPVLLVVTNVAVAQPGAAPKPPAAEAKPSAVESAIKANAAAFAKVFNQHDAKAVAAFWAEDGEYVDENGQRYSGRAEIEAQYTAFFAAYPESKLAVTVDQVRALGSSVALEQGHTALTTADNTEVSSAKYTAIHAKVGDRWLMASVRDEAIPQQAAVSQLQDLKWLIGTWTAAENGGSIAVECRWLAENHFIERKYTAKRGDEVVASGTQIIGWNGAAGRIQSWTFTSDGGHATGLWTPRRGGWVIENIGLAADGSPTTAVNYFAKIDENTLAWKSVERSIDGAVLPDAEAITLKRAPAASK